MPSERPQSRGDTAWPCPNGLRGYLKTRRSDVIYIFQNHLGEFSDGYGVSDGFSILGSCAGLSAALGLSAVNVSTAMGVSTVPMSTRPWRQRDRRALFVRRLFAVLESCSAFVRLCSFICSSVRLN